MGFPVIDGETFAAFGRVVIFFGGGGGDGRGGCGCGCGGRFNFERFEAEGDAKFVGLFDGEFGFAGHGWEGVEVNLGGC